MNQALTSHRNSDSYFPLYKARYAILQLLLVAASESATKYAVLAPDCAPDHHRVTEQRKHEWVCFYIEAYNAGIDPTTLPDINSCEELDVSNMVIA